MAQNKHALWRVRPSDMAYHCFIAAQGCDIDRIGWLAWAGLQPRLYMGYKPQSAPLGRALLSWNTTDPPLAWNHSCRTKTIESSLREMLKNESVGSEISDCEVVLRRRLDGGKSYVTFFAFLNVLFLLLSQKPKTFCFRWRPWSCGST